MKCRDVTAKIDLRVDLGSVLRWLPCRLHLLLCRDCWHYWALSKDLGDAVREYAQGRALSNDLVLERLEKSLLLKYGPKR